MTRINAGIEPKELHRLHLIAEYREIPMVPASLRRSLRTRKINAILKDIPSLFTLNRGHVLFFFDKLFYLRSRYERIKVEMRSRGYDLDETRDPGFDGFDSVFYNDWTETIEARKIVLDRINLRKSEKPHLYIKD